MLPGLACVCARAGGDGPKRGKGRGTKGTRWVPRPKRACAPVAFLVPVRTNARKSPTTSKCLSSHKAVQPGDPIKYRESPKPSLNLPPWMSPRCLWFQPLLLLQGQHHLLLPLGCPFTAVNVARASVTDRTCGATLLGIQRSSPTHVLAVARASSIASTWLTTCAHTPASGPTDALPALRDSETPLACCTTRSSTLVRSPTAVWSVSSASPLAPVWAATSSGSTGASFRLPCSQAQACLP